MRNIVKLILILALCASLLAMVGCNKKEPAPTNGTTEGTTTVPEETTGESQDGTTTEKPVNIVEDPLNNGEGDPLDAMGGTPTEDGKPSIDIELGGSTGNAGGNSGGSTGGNQGGSTGGNQGGNSGGNSGNSQGGNSGTTTPTEGNDNNQGGSTDTTDDDFSINFGDLIGKK